MEQNPFIGHSLIGYQIIINSESSNILTYLPDTYNRPLIKFLHHPFCNKPFINRCIIILPQIMNHAQFHGIEQFIPS